jgi:hypothetical protein
MQALVDSLDVVGTLVAVVCVEPKVFDSHVESRRTRDSLSKTLGLRGREIVLACPPIGGRDARFDGSSRMVMHLKKMGWTCLSFQPVELTPIPDQP